MKLIGHYKNQDFETGTARVDENLVDSIFKPWTVTAKGRFNQDRVDLETFEFLADAVEFTVALNAG